MADYGTNATDKALEKLNKKIQDIYGETAKDIQKKMDDFVAKFKVKRDILRQKVTSGEMTVDDFNNWVKGQVFQKKQWELKKYDIEHVLTNSNIIAANMINDESIQVFSANANYKMYDIEKSHGADFGFWPYDSAAVTNLIKNDPRVLPKYKVNEPKDYIWNGKKVDRQITQGILQGETLDQIAKRLAKNLSSQNMNHMKMFARTAMTSAQNAGRYQALENAKAYDMNVVKEWMATLDTHTRDTHRHMDGEQQKVGDKWHPFKFSNGCRYPGDPEGPPREIYNCRCTLVGDLASIPSEYKRYDNIDGKPIENMSYNEWYKAKMAQKQQLLAKLMAEKELKKLGKIGDVQAEINSLKKMIGTWDREFKGIWPEDVTLADYEAKKDSIQKKRDFYNNRIEYAKSKFYDSIEADTDFTYDAVSQVIDAIEKSYEPFDLSTIWNANTMDKWQNMGFDIKSFADLWGVYTQDSIRVSINKYKQYLSDLDFFEKYGQVTAPYFKRLHENEEKLNRMLELQAIINGKSTPTMGGQNIFGADAYTKERKNNALWTDDKQKVDDALRPLTGKVWQNATDLERKSIHKYTYTYHMFNEPLRGIEYGTSRFLGVGNADLNAGSEHNGKNLNAMTNIIDKSPLPRDEWFQRGVSWSGAAKFLGVDASDLIDGSEEDLKNKLLGTTPTEYGFMSMGSAKGAGFSGDVHFYIYTPKGTKAMYVEPFSRYGGGDGWQWDGKSKQSYFGSEFETILQQGTQFRVTRVRKQYGSLYVDIEVIGQDKVQRWKG